MKAFNEWQAGSRGPERRFRCSLYVDIFVPQTEDLEADRKRAEARMEKIRTRISYNSYVGGVAAYDPHNLSKPLDKEI